MDQVPQTPPQAPQMQPVSPIEPKPQFKPIPPAGSQKIWLWIAIGIVILGAAAFLGWLWWQNQTPPSAETNTPAVQAPVVQAPPEDYTSSIGNDLDKLNIESVDQNFKDIDKELDSL